MISATKPKLAPTLALRRLKENYPDAHCALNYSSPFQLLIATILSAQCTDEKVNQVTKILFAQYPNSESMSRAQISNLEEIVYPTGFYKNKAKNIKSCSEAIVQKYQGQVPQQMDQLVALAGVGRKTANVVLGNAFGIPSGVVVDTHVTRLSKRFGWTKNENAVLIEDELKNLIPQSDWIMASHLLIWHGRALCTARNPQCDRCFLADRCPKNK